MLWASALNARVLRVAASPCSCHDAAAFDLRQWTDGAVTSGTDREHVLLRGHPDIRLDVIAGILHDGPVSFLFDMVGSDAFEGSMRTLRHFLGSSNAATLPIAKILSRRMTAALRVHDARHQGASIRDIGILLFGRRRVEAEWQSPGEALKSCCRRLIAHSRFMASGGYRKVLR